MLLRLQFAIASVEIILVIISPAIPLPSGARYLTFSAILCHVLWTTLSAAFWKPSRTRSIRLGASVGQGLGAIALIWSALGCVILFCSCSVIIYAEELLKSQQSLLPTSIRILFANNPSTPETRQKYKIVFLGQGYNRTHAFRQAFNWKVVNVVDKETMETCNYPGRNDTIVASIKPHISNNDTGMACLDFIIAGATAVVVVLNLCNQASVDYVEGLRGFPEGQPGLLVAYKTEYAEEMILLEEHAERLAREHGWDFAMSINIEQAFGHLVSKMFAKPPPSGDAPELFTISSNST
ncbi:hypothetical protein NPX13_g8435 [Xylaria arbuscula]|uniref:Uncharacterized protein n=1 Tax=Xylaria arbuscula TaxID=114810 RepID=A0A9W8TIL3_9PEZI|nr:hypothetical protein NPX13_g8435 [Xylaria arbuscula]